MNSSRNVGCEHAVLEALRLLEFDITFPELGFSAPQTALAIGTIIGHACHPASERETHRCLVAPLTKHGHSKEKRSDCPLVTLALVLDGSSFPKRSHVFEGNISKATTLEKMSNKLHSTEAKPMVVMDAGMATQENIDWLKDHDYPYLVASRKKQSLERLDRTDRGTRSVLSLELTGFYGAQRSKIQ